jgi:hypothetical protein
MRSLNRDCGGLVATVLVVLALASRADAQQFGMFQADISPGGGWEIMSVADFQAHSAAFIASYNSNNGISAIKPFASGNCCVAVEGGDKLWIAGTTYGYQFPATELGQIRCNPENGYDELKYKFYQLATMDEATTEFSAKAACITSRNPAVYMLPAEAEPIDTNTEQLEFGVYDYEDDPTGGWVRVTLADLNTYKAEFIEAYNSEGGFPIIKPFTSGNCCISLDGGKKLIIEGTKYDFQFPADADTGNVKCSPSGGYTGGKVKLYLTPTLAADAVFDERSACSTSHNPTLYMKQANVGMAAPEMEFGFYDTDEVPAGGWTLMSGADFTLFRASFVKQYNDNKGIAIVAPFTTENCCIAVQGGKMLYISGTTYGYQFPAAADHGIRCNPSQGYNDAKYEFYRLTTITDEHEFSEQTACTYAHNPGVFVRSHSATGGPTPVPSPLATLPPTVAAVHCQVSGWTSWSACSKTCGVGSASRTRSVIQHAASGGFVCPNLEESGQCSTQQCPVHCVVSEWSSWGACSTTCGPGTADRIRTVVENDQHGGDGCPTLLDVQSCTDEDCASDCEVSEWGIWGECDAVCSTGAQTRERTVVTPPMDSGSTCPHVVEDRACNTQACPVHCQVGAWSDWSGCNAECGGGSQQRMRVVVVGAQYDGSACPGLQESQACNEDPCPLHCAVSLWGNWTECTKSCGSGTQDRLRTIVVDPEFNGNECPGLHEQQACSASPCPVDCVLGEYGDWGACSVSCGSGSETRTRELTTAAAHGGMACGNADDDRVCEREVCPVDCVVSMWSGWDPCTRSCGSGVTTRTRVATQVAENGGVQCGDLTETLACNAWACPISCQVSGWELWSACGVSCGASTQSRTREVTAAESNGGAACPDLSETRACNDGECPIHCTVSEFSAWSECSTSCDDGTQTHERNVTQHALHGGYECPSLVESKECRLMYCPVHCEVSAWGAWAACSLSCGNGTTAQERTVVQVAQYDGLACPELSASMDCNTQSCPINCEMSAWSNWTACSLSCGSGSQAQQRSVTVQATHGGVACESLEREQTCNVDPCPVDCTVSEWTAYSECSHTCGDGARTRTRVLFLQTQHGGKACPALSETTECHEGHCPVHCEVSDWGAWTACSKTCGMGDRSRTRTVTTHADHGGYECPFLEDSEQCTDVFCPVHCVVTEWGEWNFCSKSCGTGQREHTRSVTEGVAYGGTACPELTASEDCNTMECPVDCTVTLWSGWGDCSMSCGVGMQTRARSVTEAVAFGGTECPTLSQSQQCNTHGCPIDCRLSEWGMYGLCSTTCGVGSKERSRVVITEHQLGGQACAGLDETAECNEGPCPIHCTVSEWAAWGGCSTSCGIGSKSRSRSVTTEANHGGVVCPELTDEGECMVVQCPVHCVVSEWGDWSACSETCGSGAKAQTRTVSTPAAHNGTVCPELMQTLECNTHVCPINCELSQWTQWSECTMSCGVGIQKRFRFVTEPEANGGTACPAMEESLACNEHSCPADCVMGNYTAWGACDRSCGIGKALRSREAVTQPLFGGIACAGFTDEMLCNEWMCPVDCTVNAWADWSDCSATCGGGERMRFRTEDVPAELGGEACPELLEQEQCSTNACPIHCSVTAWGNWTACSLSCGSGTYSRERAVVAGAQHGGEVCPALFETDPCNQQACPVDCALDAWGTWSECSATCEAGAMLRTREKLTPAAHGGTACGELDETMQCDAGPCPINCDVSEWSAWSVCSEECGVGQQARYRQIVSVQTDLGHVCPTLQESRQCLVVSCPVDCELGNWTAFSECSVTCDPAGVGGTHTRTRSVLVEAQNGGAGCGDLSHTEGCGTLPCPIDCVAGPWSAYSQCTMSCGTGQYTRTREVTTVAEHGGTECNGLAQVDSCFAGECPLECTMSLWGDWSECSKSCGGGHEIRFRTVTEHPAGIDCPPITQQEPCSTHDCPVACELSPWSAWSPCSKTCGSGMETRERTVVTAPAGGMVCPSLDGARPCNTDHCVEDCMVGGWGVYGECTVTCGGGTQQRERSVMPLVEGSTCPQGTESRACGTEPCGEIDSLLLDMIGDTVAAQTYQITVKTGPYHDSGSSSPMEIRLIGDLGVSSYYYLGSNFIPGVLVIKDLVVTEDIGLLFRVELKAGGTDSWNPVNFMDIRTPAGGVVQFPMDLYLDTLVHADPAQFGAFPWTSQTFVDAVVPEVQTQPQPLYYQLQYATGMFANGTSTSPMFVQFHGTHGDSRFYQLGSSFEGSPGEQMSTSMTVDEDVGLLNRITLKAGGMDDWECEAFVSVLTQLHQTVQFPTQFWMDLTPHAGEWFAEHYFATKDVTALNPETDDAILAHMFGTTAAPQGGSSIDDMLGDMIGGAMPAPTDAPTTPWEHIHSDLEDLLPTPPVTLPPTATPTAAPTDPTTNYCPHGDLRVPPGWTGKGAANNYCNFCKCEAVNATHSDMACTELQCGVPWGGVVPSFAENATECSHVSCQYFKDPFGHDHRIAVQHHHLEGKTNHKCSYDSYKLACTCWCWGETEQYLPAGAHQDGRADITMGSFDAEVCKTISFDKAFNPGLGVPRVMTTLTHTDESWVSHDPNAVWVKDVTNTGFTFCGKETRT